MDSDSDAPEIVPMKKAKEQLKGQIMKSKSIKKISKSQKNVSSDIRQLISSKISPNIAKFSIQPKEQKNEVRSLKINDINLTNHVNKNVSVKLQRRKLQPVRQSVKEFQQKQFNQHKRQPLHQIIKQ